MPTIPPKHIRENALESLFADRIKRLGGMAIKLAPTKAGNPDRLVLFPRAQIYLVELKVELGECSPIQKHWHERARCMGIEVIVLHGRNEILEWIAEVVERSKPAYRKPYTRRPKVEGTEHQEAS